MAGFWSGLKKRLVLDIGSSAVRVCELTKTKTGYEVAKFVQREYNSDPSLEEEQRKELRAQALREALKEAKVRKRKTILGVPGQSVFTRCRALPPVPEYKVSQIVRYEIQQQIPFGLDQIAMDYQILGRTEQGGYDVMMAAIKVDVVEKQLDVLKPVKCPIAIVDVLPLAAYNWLKKQKSFGDQGDCVAMIDLGAGTTDIVIERGNQFRFTRPLNVGGNDVTKALMDAFNMDFVSAERIKRERGFAPTGDSKRDGKGGEVIGQVLQRLSTEIIRSFSYFRSLPGGGQVNRVVLTGGGARLKNIVPYLRNQLEMEVQVAQTLTDIKIGKDAQAIQQHAEQAAVVLGMGLRTCEEVTIGLNLIPPRIVEVARQKEQALYWALSICALVLIFASLVPASANENKQVQQRIEALKAGIRAYDRELVLRIRPGTAVPPSELRSQLERRRRHLQTLEDQVRTLDMARNQRRFWLEELSLVNEARPVLGQMWFSSMETTILGEEPQEGQQPQERARMGRVAPGAAPGGVQRSPGFFGLQMSGGAGGGVARRMPGPGAGAGATSGGPFSLADDVSVPRPNGLIVHGYAESDEAITEFVEELKSAVRMLPSNWFLMVDRVIFSEASVQRKPWSVLYDAPVDGPTTGRTGGEPGPGEPGLFSFTVEVKFRFSQEHPGRTQPQQSEGAET